MAKRANDVSTKIDAEVLRLSKMAADAKGISVAQYISETMAEQAGAFLDEWMKANRGQAKKPKGGKA